MHCQVSAIISLCLLQCIWFYSLAPMADVRLCCEQSSSGHGAIHGNSFRVGVFSKTFSENFQILVGVTVRFCWSLNFHTRCQFWWSWPDSMSQLGQKGETTRCFFLVEFTLSMIEIIITYMDMCMHIMHSMYWREIIRHVSYLGKKLESWCCLSCF